MLGSYFHDRDILKIFKSGNNIILNCRVRIGCSHPDIFKLKVTAESTHSYPFV